MEINKVTPEDYSVLEKIGKETLKIYYDQYDIQSLDNINNNILLKGIMDNHIIGFIFCSDNDNNIHINSFAIKEEYQNKGYGTQFINKIKEYNKTLSLNTEEENHNAIQFYKKNEFQIKELRYNYYENLKNSNAYFMKYDIN
tara:strand:- start:228 stop:653 length:426 start_codon:yes stop_codon:yes gene_type:complete